MASFRKHRGWGFRLFFVLALALICLFGCSSGSDNGCESQSFQQGLDAWANKDSTGAKTFFAQAVQVCPDNDAYNFIYGMVLGADVSLGDGSTGDPSLGVDMMTPFGVTDWQPFAFFQNFFNLRNVHTNGAGEQVELAANELPFPLPATSPTGGEVQAWLYEQALPQLLDAVDYLNMVAENSEVEWTWPETGEKVISDYGDVLGFRFTYEYMITMIYIQLAYNANFNIAEFRNALGTDPGTTAGLLANNPGLLSLSGTCRDNLEKAREYVPKACNDAIAALDWIVANRDPGAMAVFNIDDWTQADIDGHKKGLNEVIQSLSQATVITGLIPDGAGGWRSINTNLDTFLNGVDIRNPSLLPNIAGNVATGQYPNDWPDSTFGGVFPGGLDVLDADEAGPCVIPDVLN